MSNVFKLKRKIDLAELYGPGAKFPIEVAVKPRKLTAYEFAGQVGGTSSYQFGMDRDACALALHEIADRIKSGDLILQSGRVMSVCKIDDFPMTFLRLQFHEGPKKKNEEKPQ